MEVNETHEKIVGLLSEKGPSLPIQVAKELSMNSLFISAFLSELVNSKRVRVSNLKVGGSPLYFLRGQEELLESFHKFLHPRESEAFLLLKEKKVLRDNNLEPAMRVAIRAIKDFAVPFEDSGELFWKYVLVSDEEAGNILRPERKKERPTIIEEKTIKEDITKKAEKTLQKNKESKSETTFENPLIIEEKPASKKEKPKSDFALNIMDHLEKKGFSIIEEREFKKNEFNCLVRINSDLGPMTFLTLAKDKKIVSDSDLKKHLSNAQKIPLPALFIYTGNLSKKANLLVEQYDSVLKTIKII